MDYGEVLAKSWKIFWKFKILWIFGILASCGRSGGGARGGGGTSFRQNFNNPPTSANPFPEFQQFFNQVQRFFEQIPVWVYFVVVLAFIVLVLVVIFISTVGKIGLVHGAWLADEGVDKLSFGQLWSESMGYFWRVFALSLIALAIVLVLFVVVLLPAFLISIATFGIGLFCFIPLICLLIPVLWAIGVWIDQATVAVVGENRHVFESLSRSWGLLKVNIGPYIIMALILFIGGAIVGIIIAIPMFIILIPLFVSLFAGGLTGNAPVLGTGMIVSIVLLCIYIPIAWFLNGLLQTYTSNAWTLTFRRLSHPAEAPVTPAPTPEPTL